MKFCKKNIKKTILLFSSVLVATPIIFSIFSSTFSKSNNKITQDLAYSQLKQNDTVNEKSGVNYVGTNWNTKVIDGEKRVFLSALDNTGFSLRYPYTIDNNELKDFFSKTYKSIFVGNYKQPLATNFLISDVLANNKEGWLDVTVTCKGYYDEKNIWVDGYMPYTMIRISDFKKAKPTPFVINQKVSNGSVIEYNDYASNLYDSISNDKSISEIVSILGNVVNNFDINNFPSDANIRLVTDTSSVNNDIGIVNIGFLVESFFQDDEYCTYSNSDIVINGSIQCSQKGISSFKTNTLNYLELGASTFGSLTTSDVVDKLVSKDPQFTKWAQDIIYNNILSPYPKSSPLSIVFSEKKEDYYVDAASGIVVLSGNIKNVIVDNDTIRNNYIFNMHNSPLIITGLNKVVNTTVLKQPNYPIIDFSNSNSEYNQIFKPSQVKQKIIESIGKSWSDPDNFAKKFFLVLNPPFDIDNFRIKEFDAEALDDTGELKVTNLVFQNANIDGSLGDLVVCSKNSNQLVLQNFIYTFPIEMEITTNISELLYIPYEISKNLYPYEFDFSSNKTKIKEIIKEILISNIAPNFNIDTDLDVELVETNPFSNSEGQIKANVYLRKYLKNNQLIDLPTNDKTNWLKKTITISGFRTTNPTFFTRKIDYPHDLLPSDLVTYLDGKTDFEKFKMFFEIFNLPSNQDSDLQNNISNFKVESFDNLNGIANLSCQLNNGYFENDAYSSFVSNKPLVINETFNLFNHSSPTTLNNIIEISGVNNFTTSDFINSILNGSSQENESILKKSIYDNSNNVPDIVDATNFNEWIKVENFRPSSSEDMNLSKSFIADVMVNKYYDDQGILCETEKGSEYKVFKDILFKGDFRNVKNTRFKNGLTINVSSVYPEATNINCESWGDNEVSNFIFKYWKDFSMITGDIPPSFDIKSSLIIKNKVYKVDEGRIDVEVSLSNFYNDQQLVNNPNGYFEKTVITLRGFSSQEDTVLIDTSTTPILIGNNSYLTDWISNKSEDEIKQVVINNVFLGSVKDVLPSDITNFVINRIDDKLGMISFSFQLNKYWENYNLIDSTKPNFEPLICNNVWISGFKSRVESSFSSKTIININQPLVIATNFYNDSSHDDLFWKTLFKNNNIMNASTLPSDIDLANNILFDRKNVVINNREGSITFNDVKFEEYYGQTFSLRRNNGNYVDKIVVNKVSNQDKLSEFPYPTSIEDKPSSIISSSPTTSIIVKGFQVINEQTSLIDDSILDYESSSFLVQNGYSSSYIFNALNDVDNPNHNLILNDFRKNIFNDCVLGTKIELNNTDIDIEPISYDSRNGTIVVRVKLNKYWNENCDLVNSKLDPSSQPLIKEYTFRGFIPSIDTILTTNLKINAKNIGNLIEKTASELKNLLVQENSLYVSQIKQTIINECISGNKNSPINSPENIILTNFVDNDVEGTLEITFKVNQIWWDGLITSNSKNDYKVIITNLKKQRTTSVLSPIDLNDWYTDDTKTIRFNVRNIYANDFLNSSYNNNDFDTNFKNLLSYNKSELIFDPANNSDPKNIVITKKIANDNDIEVTFDMVAKVLKNNVIVEESASFNVKLIGFKKIISGPTKLNRKNNVLINDPLASWVISNKIDAYTFYQIMSNPKNDNYQKLYMWTEQILFENCIDQFSNIGQGKPYEISPSDIVILEKPVDGSTPNIFDATSPISFYLKNFYDENGNYVSNATQEMASKNFLLKTVTLYPFIKVESNNQPTIGIADNSTVQIGSVKIGKDEIDNIIEDNTLTQIKASDVLKSEYNSLFKAWIMQNLYSGNLNGILFNSIDDANNVELINPSLKDANDEEGYIIISARLKKYWEKDGFGQNGCPIVNIKVEGFTKVSSTKFNNVTHDLTINTPSSSNFQVIINEIKSSKPKEFISKVYSKEIDSKLLISYIKSWIVTNRNEVFSFLPNNMSNSELFDNLYIDVDENGFPIMTSDKPGEIKLSIGLKKYLNSNGDLVTPPSQPLVSQLSFAGFSMVGEPTKLAAESIVSIEKLQANLPWFVAHDRDGAEYSSITVDKIVNNNEFIDNNEKNVIKRIILNKPDKSQGESSNQYKILDGKLSSNVGTPGNIYIDRVIPYPSLGQIDIYYHLGVAWTAEDDNEPTNKRLSGRLTLVGFKTIDPIIQAGEKISPFIIGGIAGGISVIVLILVFIIFYRKRKEIEYQQ